MASSAFNVASYSGVVPHGSIASSAAVAAPWLADSGADGLDLAADGQHHHLIGRPQALDERARRRGGRGEPVARHAEAAIEPMATRQRELPRRKCPDGLRRAVLLHPEIGRLVSPVTGSPLASVTEA